ncbi:lachesin-like isoform X1 [Vespula maculifrons]|uniref:Lachesin-like isoform X1 n=1 Tax=Vespula maculifrons TaxID=7453 RepID=A0ABD2CKS6_VESMC
MVETQKALLLVVLAVLAYPNDIFGGAYQPEFAGPLTNLTISLGRDATFTCLVKHLGGYRVGWLKADTKAIQAIHDHVITHNKRISVSHSDHTIWNLNIKAVQLEDEGLYMCQINTDPMKSQTGMLTVVVPPDFVLEDTSSDVNIGEGGQVKLTCRARGIPRPRVSWRREDGKGIIIREPAGSALNQKSHAVPLLFSPPPPPPPPPPSSPSRCRGFQVADLLNLAENLTLVFYLRLRPILNRLVVWHTNTSRFNEPYTSRRPPHPRPHPPPPPPPPPPSPSPSLPSPRPHPRRRPRPRPHPHPHPHPPHPPPPQRPLIVVGVTIQTEFYGEELNLTKVSRTEMGIYLCIASNGIPPAVSKRISINVHFPPAIHVPNQLVGAPLGTDVVLECYVEASPMSINYWIKEKGITMFTTCKQILYPFSPFVRKGMMIISSTQHVVDVIEKSPFEVRMTLTIKNLQKHDVGTYLCAAKNSLGEVDSTIRLYEIPGPAKTELATWASFYDETNNKIPYGQTEMNKAENNSVYMENSLLHGSNHARLPPTLATALPTSVKIDKKRPTMSVSSYATDLTIRHNALFLLLLSFSITMPRWSQ